MTAGPIQSGKADVELRVICIAVEAIIMFVDDRT